MSRPKGTLDHKPTEIDRAEVRTFAICQWPHEKIAAYLDISVETLTKHYKEELNKGLGKILHKSRNVMETHIDNGSLKAAMYVLSSKGGFEIKQKDPDDDKEKSTLMSEIAELIKKHEQDA